MSLAAPTSGSFCWIGLPVGTSGARVCRCAWKWAWIHPDTWLLHTHVCRKRKRLQTLVGWVSLEVLTWKEHGQKCKFFRRLGFGLWGQLESWMSMSKRFTVGVGGDCWQCFLISTMECTVFCFFTRLTSEGFTYRDRLLCNLFCPNGPGILSMKVLCESEKVLLFTLQWLPKTHLSDLMSRVLFSSFSYFIIHAPIFSSYINILHINL